MTPPIPPRPSAAVIATAHFETILNDVLMKLLGLALFIGMGYLDYLTVRKPAPSTVPLAIFSGLAIFGAALTCTDPIVNLISRLAGIVTPLLPARWRGKDSNP